MPPEISTMETNLARRRKRYNLTKLGALQEGMVCNVILMVGRRWDARSPDGYDISTECLLSNYMGNIVHLSAPRNVTRNVAPRLYDGNLYHITNLKVVRNKQKHRIRSSDDFMLVFQDHTKVEEFETEITGFNCSPFKFVNFEEIVYVENKYLIDIVGDILFEQPLRKKPEGFEYLDLELTNERGIVVSITLSGYVTQDFFFVQLNKPLGASFIFTSMDIIEDNGTLYLFSSNHTQVYSTADFNDRKQCRNDLNISTSKGIEQQTLKKPTKLDNESSGATAADNSGGNHATSLDNLHVGEVRDIEVIVSRRWINKTPKYQYMSTEYLLSDRLCNIVQCMALRQGALSPSLQLSEGHIYQIRNVLVTRNQDTHRVCKKNNCALLFLDGTTVSELDLDTAEFGDYPFNFVDFEDIQYVYDEYLIDVVGYVHSVGRTTELTNGYLYLECKLMNTRGVVLEVILWGKFAKDFLTKRAYKQKTDAIVFAAMSVQQSEGVVYLISTMDTVVYSETELEGFEELTIALSNWTRSDSIARNLLEAPNCKPKL